MAKTVKNAIYTYFDSLARNKKKIEANKNKNSNPTGFGQYCCEHWSQISERAAKTEGVYILNDDVIKRKHFPRYRPFVREIHRSPVNSPHKGQRRRALMFSLICDWINSWVKNREAGDLRRHRVHYDVIVMIWKKRKTEDGRWTTHDGWVGIG